MSLKAIQTRIRSIQSSRKITNAMQFISAARAKQFQKSLVICQQHVEHLQEIIDRLPLDIISNCRSLKNFSALYKDATGMCPDEEVTLLPSSDETSRGGGDVVEGDSSDNRSISGGVRWHTRSSCSNDQKKHLVVVIAADRGLCGYYNTAIIRHGQETAADIHDLALSKGESIEIDCITVGTKANDIVQSMMRKHETRDHHILSCFLGKTIKFDNIRQNLILPIFHEMISHEYEACSVIYSHSVSTSKQQPEVFSLWPIVDMVVNDRKETSEVVYIDPKAEEFLPPLMLDYMESKIYEIVLDSKLSESNARMLAMDNADRNSEKAIGELKRHYNNARQENITKELSEIVGGSEASRSSEL